MQMGVNLIFHLLVILVVCYFSYLLFQSLGYWCTRFGASDPTGRTDPWEPTNHSTERRWGAAGCRRAQLQGAETQQGKGKRCRRRQDGARNQPQTSARGILLVLGAPRSLTTTWERQRRVLGMFLHRQSWKRAPAPSAAGREVKSTE